MARLGCGTILLLLFLPCAVVRGRVGPNNEPNPCQPYAEFFCTCDYPQNARPVSINICLTYDNGTPSCEPCARHFQDFIDCDECPGEECPVCFAPNFSSDDDISWQNHLVFVFSPSSGEVEYLSRQMNRTRDIQNTNNVHPENPEKRGSVKKSWPDSDRMTSVALQQNLAKLNERELEQIHPKPSFEILQPMRKVHQNRSLNETVADIKKGKDVDSVSDTSLTRGTISATVEQNASEQHRSTPVIFSGTLVRFKPVNLTKSKEKFASENLRIFIKILGLPLNKENESAALKEIPLENFSENFNTPVDCYKLLLTTHFIPKSSIRVKREQKRNHLRHKSLKFENYVDSINILNSMEDDQSEALNVTLNICSKKKFDHHSFNSSSIRNKREPLEESRCFLNKTRKSLHSNLGAVFEFKCSMNSGELFSNFKLNKPFLVMKHSKKYKTNFFKTDLGTLILDIKKCFSTDKLIFYHNETKIDVSNCHFTRLSDLVHAHAVKAIEIPNTFGAPFPVEFKTFENLISNIYLDIAMTMELSEDYFMYKLFKEPSSDDSFFPVRGLLQLKMTLFFGDKTSTGEIKEKELSSFDRTQVVRDLFLGEMHRWNENRENSRLEKSTYTNLDNVSTGKPSSSRSEGKKSNRLFRFFVSPKKITPIRSKSGRKYCSRKCRVCKVFSASANVRKGIRCRIVSNLKKKYGCRCSTLPKRKYLSKSARHPKKQNSKFQTSKINIGLDQSSNASELNSTFDPMGTEVIHNVENEYYEDEANTVNHLFSGNLNRFKSFPKNVKRNVHERDEFETFSGEMCFKNINFDFSSNDVSSDDPDMKDQFSEKQGKNSVKLGARRRMNSPTSDEANVNQKSTKFQTTLKLSSGRDETFFHFFVFDADSLKTDKDVGGFADEAFDSLERGLSNESINVCLNGGDGNAESGKGTLFIRTSSYKKPGEWKTLDEEVGGRWTYQIAEDVENGLEDALEILMLSPMFTEEDGKKEDKNNINQKVAHNIVNFDNDLDNDRHAVFSPETEKMPNTNLDSDKFRESGVLGVKLQAEEEDMTGNSGTMLGPKRDYVFIYVPKDVADVPRANTEKTEKTTGVESIVWIIERLNSSVHPNGTNVATGSVSEESANSSMSGEENVRDHNLGNPMAGTRADNASSKDEEVRSQDPEVTRNESGNQLLGFEMPEDLDATVPFQNVSENEIENDVDSRTKQKRDADDDECDEDLASCILEGGDIQECLNRFGESIGVGSFMPDDSTIPDNDWCPLNYVYRSGNIHCVFRPDHKECTIYCHDGYSVHGKKSAKMTCTKEEGAWEPEDLECEKDEQSRRPPAPPPPEYDYDFPDSDEGPRPPPPPPPKPAPVAYTFRLPRPKPHAVSYLRPHVHLPKPEIVKIPHRPHDPPVTEDCPEEDRFPPPPKHRHPVLTSLRRTDVNPPPFFPTERPCCGGDSMYDGQEYIP